MLTTDSPNRRIGGGEGEEVVQALGLDPAGGIIALASTVVDGNGAFFVARFPE